MTPDEEWRPVVGWEDRYAVSSLGRLHSLVRDRPMKPHTGDRYPKVCLKRDGRQQTSYVHRLVMAAFVGPCPEGMEVCHNDGDPMNNRVENLRYDTHSSNQYDIARHGHHWNANKTHCKNGHEFTEANTRKRPSGTGRACKTCERLSNRVKILIGRPRGEANHKAKLTEADVRALRLDAGTGMTWADLGRRYGIAAQTARNIALRNNWKHVA